MNRQGGHDGRCVRGQRRSTASIRRAGAGVRRSPAWAAERPAHGLRRCSGEHRVEPSAPSERSARMRAILIESEGAAPRLLEDADETLLSGDVALDVLATGLNYKDGMALAGKGIARTHPL